ncbi:MAG: enoyl-CoA hydratase-related protein [Aliishimia sp.]
MNQTLSQGHLVETITDGVLTIQLGAAPAHPLSLGMIRALQASLDNAAGNSDVRMVVVHGAGRIFCAGHDLKEIKRHRQDPDDGRAYIEVLFKECSDMMLTLARLPQPTMAIVEGVASAGGLQLMSSCDLVFVSEDAKFCLPGVNNGGFCSTPAVAVGRKVPRNQVLELGLSGEMFDADWGLRTGLVTRVHAQDALLEKAMAFANTLAARYAPSITSGKAMLYKQLELPLEQAYTEATVAMIEHFMDPHRIEAEKKSRF